MIEEFTTCTRNLCNHGLGTNLWEICTTLDLIQPFDKTSTNGHWNWSFSSLALKTNKGLLQKRMTLKKSCLLSSTKQTTRPISAKFQSRAKKNLQNWTILHYVWLSERGDVNFRKFSMKFLITTQPGIGMMTENILLL